MKREYYFYVLRHPETLKIRYFGKTINPNKRLKQHIYESKNCNTYKCNWIRSLKKSPILEIIYKEFCTVKESSKVEKTILRKFMKMFNLTNSWDNCVGAYKTGKLVYQYNLNGDFIRTFENANHASTITKIPSANILRACKKSSKKGYNKAGNFLWLHEKYDKYPYPLHIYNGEKPVIQFDLQDNKIAEFKSAREAFKKTKISYKLISAVCRGTKKQTHGYKFKFKT